jgi:hypothetical protein
MSGESKNYLVRYIRDAKTRHPVGVMVALNHGFPDSTDIDIGYCFCNPKDHFTKKRAVEIALGRAQVGSVAQIPNKKIHVVEKDENHRVIGVSKNKVNLQKVFKRMVMDFSEKAYKYFANGS